MSDANSLEHVGHEASEGSTPDVCDVSLGPLVKEDYPEAMPAAQNKPQAQGEKAKKLKDPQQIAQKNCPFSSDDWRGAGYQPGCGSRVKRWVNS